MKRPEGFDPPGRPQPQPPGRKPARSPRPAGAPKPARSQPARSQPVAPQPRAQPAAPQPRRTPTTGRGIPASREPRPDAAARAELRRAARERRRFERAEVRRFTRRARNRRIGIAAIGGLVVTLIGMVLLAVYSPLLALRTVVVDGTSRVDAALVQDAVDAQLGTPLALVDYDRITRDLAAFPLIRSYVTEVVPPDTLLIHVTERQPVGQFAVDGVFRMVDPAGVSVQDSAERVPGIPVIELPGSTVPGPQFDAVVEVLLALPPDLLARVDRASARTQDDVSLVLVGVGQGVEWGSADNSARKAALLERLIAAIDPSRPGTFDVSAPSNGIFHPS
ncbi:FtsQ-type POTRA domain-containing protein [Leifsonia sp. H3M29-4]|uniref:FtsQ-type POTRA domain-containing protein n=1 Tax=Salinibacterium metalliresistens TaxID=3031321 RepID=UPI0023DB9CFF|nr:FtsQ-type POTRA domain-containing protein [Salinibacterium metalliresistens]MDF1480162.1 FtsQ-type POTRA domain-containing protein [Salinibacterium metalliresistens]